MRMTKRRWDEAELICELDVTSCCFPHDALSGVGRRTSGRDRGASPKGNQCFRPPQRVVKRVRSLDSRREAEARRSRM